MKRKTKGEPGGGAECLGAPWIGRPIENEDAMYRQSRRGANQGPDISRILDPIEEEDPLTPRCLRKRKADLRLAREGEDPLRSLRLCELIELLWGDLDDLDPPGLKEGTDPGE
jgi:hypothetical protein